ncbi:MAG TPA: hypothetical protein VGG06_29230 [Thermoanaerobaculia bacterium]|jgi:hypothetical protein
MSLLGIHLTLLIGRTLALPAPVLLTENLESVEVTAADQGRSGFQLVFKGGRSGFFGALDEPLLRSPLLKPFNRVILIVTFNVRPRVLMDGIIVNQELNPGANPGETTITVTGEDVSVMMDQDERIAEHPAQPDFAIVAKLILKYARFGLVPVVIPPRVIDPPIPLERIPVQCGLSDLGYIAELGERHGHVFHVTPGPAPFVNQAYWGPPKRIGVPQRALSVNFGSETNVSSISFQHDGRAPTLVDGDVQDRRTNRKFPVRTFASLRLPPLAALPTALVHRSQIRSSVFRAGGVSAIGAFGRAQAETDLSTDQVVTATGELDALRYGDVLRSRGLVGLRGAGFTYDGLYYVRSVTHSIRRGQYTQNFTLTREGVGSITPVVRP